MMRLHGVSHNGDGTGELRFAMHTLLHRIGEPSEAVTWSNIWMDGLFGKARYKFHRLCWDALHAADHLERTMNTAGVILLNPARNSSDAMDAVATATKDATLYLDVLIFYFRILADCVAMVVPNLYGLDGKAIKRTARDSFRAHRKWFEKNSHFDPAYASILAANTQWFDRLSGDKGWRDDLVHRAATWQIAVVSGTVVSLHVGLDRPAQPPYPNLIDELREAVRGFCVFLDRMTMHFAIRINSQSSAALFDLTAVSTWACHFRDGGSRGMWILPELTSQK